MRHFGDEIPLGIFVFTLPPAVRARCVGSMLHRFRRAAVDLAEEVLRRHVGNDRAKFWVRGWLHPEGDGLEHEYHPHENVLVPLAWYDPQTDRAHRVGRHALPECWFGKDGWVSEAWRSKLRVLFPELAPDCAVDWFYEYQSDPAGKLHALKYFGRTFPWWARTDGIARCLRPISRGLSHWKCRKGLARVLARVAARLPPESSCQECLKEGVHQDELPERIPVVGATQDQVEKRAAAAVAAHTCAACQAHAVERPDAPYLDYRRIMAGGLGIEPTTGPPNGPSPPVEWVDSVSGELHEGHSPSPSLETSVLFRKVLRESMAGAGDEKTHQRKPNTIDLKLAREWQLLGEGAPDLRGFRAYLEGPSLAPTKRVAVWNEAGLFAPGNRGFYTYEEEMT